MKNRITKQAVLFFFLAAGLIAAKPIGDPVQVKFRAQSGGVQIAGTSSLHDWTEKSDKGIAEATFAMNNDKITDLSALTFTLASKSLKSEHTMMDNNTYKALNADKNPNITFVGGSATVTMIDASTYTIKSTGKLTIAGNTRETDIVATGKINPDKSITVTGSKKFKMTDYGIKPPTAMLGTIKTGDDLTISYNLKFIK
jgi:YceI-like domain